MALPSIQLRRKKVEAEFTLDKQHLLTTAGSYQSPVPLSEKAYHPSLNSNGQLFPIIWYLHDASVHVDYEEDQSTTERKTRVLHCHRVTQVPDVDPRNDPTIKLVMDQEHM